MNLQKRRKTKHDLISEEDFNENIHSRVAFPAEDSPGGSDVLENRETLIGMSYVDDEPEETELDSEAPMNPQELEEDPSEAEARDEADEIDPDLKNHKRHSRP